MASQLEAAGATIHVVPMRRITTSATPAYWAAYVAGWPVAVLRLCRLARRTGAGVIHSNSLHSWYGWAVAALLRRPHVWHAREVVVQSAAALKVERFLARRFAKVVVAVSGVVAAQLDGAAVVVEYDYADPAEFNPGRAGAFRALVGIDDDVPLVGVLGRIDTWKGLDVVLDAVGPLQQARPHLQLVVAGGTVPGKEAFAQRLAERARHIRGVTWLGAEDDAGALVADLDVLVQASTEPEPFGLAVVEALACGVPVVATDAGGPVEILAAAAPGAGRLVPPNDAGALAEAVLALLPASQSSTDDRRRRPVLRTPPAGRLVEVFDGVVAGPA